MQQVTSPVEGSRLTCTATAIYRFEPAAHRPDRGRACAAREPSWLATPNEAASSPVPGRSTPGRPGARSGSRVRDASEFAFQTGAPVGPDQSWPPGLPSSSPPGVARLRRGVSPVGGQPVGAPQPGAGASPEPPDGSLSPGRGSLMLAVAMSGSAGSRRVGVLATGQTRSDWS
jgi:hypothetical protein